MEVDEYAALLGKLATNLQGLEFALRLFLAEWSSGRSNAGGPGVNYYGSAVGSTVPENEFTNYDPLSQLIKKFNREAASVRGEEVDATIVELRDALAHGRVSSPVGESHFHLIKFDKPDRSGHVRVEFNQELTQEWLAATARRVLEAVMIVGRAIEKAQSNSAPSRRP